jgi:peptide/nickel transport system ATP-binding protein
VACHWAEDIRDGRLQPRSAEEVLRADVDVRGSGAGGVLDDGFVGGVSAPIERT